MRNPLAPFNNWRCRLAPDAGAMRDSRISMEQEEGDTFIGREAAGRMPRRQAYPGASSLAGDQRFIGGPTNSRASRTASKGHIRRSLSRGIADTLIGQH